jgi:DNA-directed RNA polymerase subunit beta'
MKNTNFDYIQLKLASPEDILSWSRGEVKKPETINYRTHRAEPDGLMCEKIFGPTKDYECYCGKYKKYKYKGIICDKCGVEVTKRSVRRERMGHIRLASPVTHVWFAHGIPNKISIILDIPQKKLQSVIYFSRYLVVESDTDGKQMAIEQVNDKIKDAVAEVDAAIGEKIKAEEATLKDSIDQYKASKEEVDDLELENLEYKSRQRIAKIREEGNRQKNEVEAEMKVLLELVNRIAVGETVTEEEHVLLLENEISFFSLRMGAEAIQYLLQKLDVASLSEQLKEDIKSTNIQKRLKAIQRLRLVNGLLLNEMAPEWMVLDVIPVIPPELRPIVQISGGRFATADLNDLYRRVINRNNRLKRLIELGAPEVILRNEKRMLQEAVDALIDNEHRLGNPVVNKRKVPLKSLSATLRGKQGRFRQNLLGKRVDYSGRAVIVTAGRDLKLNQVGVPKQMALELFKPFVVHQLIERGLAANARSAKFMIEERDKTEEVWNILEEVIQGHPVLINRAPTLHKQSIQAYFPVLVEGDALRIHPLIVEGFNADFDGDQMAIHVPLTEEAIKEAIELMMPNANMLKAASGEFIMNPGKDLVQAIYYLTTFEDMKQENLPVFYSKIEAEGAYQHKIIGLRQPVKVNVNGELVETSVGRIIFNQMLPEGYDFVNEIVNKKVLKRISLDIFRRYTVQDVADTLNKINDIGFKYSTTSGFSTGLNDLQSIPDLDKKIDEALKKTEEIENYYRMGLLTPKDKSDQFAKLWIEEFTPSIEKATKEFLKDGNSLKEVADSGSRYGYDVINQVVGVKGVVVDATQKTVELPIISNYLKGFSAFEYFISAKGARKGLADTALRTADSGYLTRKLCEVSQDSLIRAVDCGQTKGIFVDVDDDKSRSISFQERLIGRVPAAEIVSKKGEVLAPAGEIINQAQAKAIAAEGITRVEVRTPLTCKTRFGVCQKCYGTDYSTNQMVAMGKAVGILAAQSIGEPATQLVLRTFYKSGAAGDDITTGMPRLQELFEARIPKGQAIIAEIGGTVEIEDDGKGQNIVRIKNVVVDTIDYPYTKEDKLVVKSSIKAVKGGDLLFITKSGEEVRSSRKGKLTIKDEAIIIETNITEEVEYKVSIEQELLVGDGDKIEAGIAITRGNIDPRQLLQAKGITEAQKYIIDEIQRVYQVQGILLGDKHIEIIVAQMGRYVRVVDPGDSGIIPGEFKDKYVVDEINEQLVEAGKRPMRVSPQLLGITAAALKTESFLAAASFQEQVRVLSDAALMGKRDYLRGLKENVIIGRMIPTGDAAMNVH